MRFFSLMSVLIPVWRLDDQVIAACGSAKVGRVAGVEEHGRAVGDDRHPAGAGQRRVEEAAAHHPGHALDALDVPVDAGVERQQVRAVHGDRVVLEVDQVDVLRGVREEDLAAAGHLHERGALARDRLLDHAAEAAASRRARTTRRPGRRPSPRPSPGSSPGRGLPSAASSSGARRAVLTSSPGTHRGCFAPVLLFRRFPLGQATLDCSCSAGHWFPCSCCSWPPRRLSRPIRSCRCPRSGPGMHCTGLSVIRGTEISSFDVEILDVIAAEPGLSGPRILDPRLRPRGRLDRDRPGLLGLARDLRRPQRRRDLGGPRRVRQRRRARHADRGHDPRPPARPGRLRTPRPRAAPRGRAARHTADRHRALRARGRRS